MEKFTVGNMIEYTNNEHVSPYFNKSCFFFPISLSTEQKLDYLFVYSYNSGLSVIFFVVPCIIKGSFLYKIPFQTSFSDC